MRTIPLYLPLILALIAAIFCSALFPNLHLCFFAPFLALCYYIAPLSKALWISLGCGIILDLLSSEFRFGLMSLTAVLTTLVLYKQKKHFFEDQPLALSLFSSAVSAAFMTIQITLVALLDQSPPLSWPTLLIDTLLMSCVDGLYAFLWFTCPLKLYKYIKKVGWKGVIGRLEHEKEQG